MSEEMKEKIQCKVIGFRKSYSKLNLKMMENPQLYELALIVIYLLEVGDGFGVKKVLKTTKKGTNVNYEAFKTEEELNKYIDKVKGMLKDYNEKYGTGYKI